MPKKDIHPEWYDNTEVYCDGKLVYTVSSTKEKLNVDILFVSILTFLAWINRFFTGISSL